MTGGGVYGMDINAQRGRIYLVGTFKRVGGQPVSNGFTSIDLATARLTPGVAQMGVNTTRADMHYSFDVLAVNGRVWVAGSQHSLQILTEDTLELETFYLSQHRGDFQDLLLVGDVVYAGCHCRRDTTMVRSNGIVWWGPPPPGVQNAPILESNPNSWVNAFDARTGLRYNEYVPDIDSRGLGIWVLHEAPGSCLWIGGPVGHRRTGPVLYHPGMRKRGSWGGGS